eukprot:GFYU01007073.1.p1 GENE.GFYU01007073.1~~GFYU01007073.1.p1  ORF type:complete len:472 (+),score=29.28 GFYU01007073.1:67-1482(+)
MMRSDHTRRCHAAWTPSQWTWLRLLVLAWGCVSLSDPHLSASALTSLTAPHETPTAHYTATIQRSLGRTLTIEEEMFVDLLSHRSGSQAHSPSDVAVSTQYYTLAHHASRRTNEVNPDPVVGILTLPTEQTELYSLGASFIPTSLSKFFESAAVRASPVQYDMSKGEMLRRLASVNGLVVSDAGTEHMRAPNTIYAETVHALLELLSASNDAGLFYPIFVIGAPSMTMAEVYAANTNATVVTKFPYVEKPFPLHWKVNKHEGGIREFLAQRRVDGRTNRTFDQDMEEFNVAFVQRAHGIPLSAFEEDAGVLSRTFRVSATFKTKPAEETASVESTVDANNAPISDNTTHLTNFTDSDAEGATQHIHRIANSTDEASTVEYVAIFEGRTTPVIAMLWHPELAQFEWPSAASGILHSFPVIRSMQQIARYFATLCRQNSNNFITETEENESMMFNTRVTHTSFTDKWEECYIF